MNEHHLGTSRLGAVAFMLCGLLLAITAFSTLTPERIGFLEDMGLSMAVGDAMRDGHKILLGPPSHLTGRHLGPIGYWWVAGPQALAGGDLLTTFAILAVVEFLACLALSLLCVSISSGPFRWWAGAGTLLCMAASKYTEIFISPWHNHFLIVFSTLFLIAAVIGLRSPRWGLPLAFLSGSILIQFHYSSIPLVALWGFAVLVSRLRAPLRPDSLRSKIIRLAIYLLGAVTWIPLLSYEWAYPGTLHYTLFSNTLGSAVGAGFADAGDLLFGFIKGFLLGADFVPSVFHDEALWIVRFAIFACGWLALQTLRKGAALERKVVLLSLLSLALYWPVVARLAPPLYPSFFYALLPIPALLLGSGWHRAIRELSESKSPVIRVLALSALGVLTSGYAREINFGSSQKEFHPPQYSLKHVQDIARLVSHDHGGEPFTVESFSASRITHASLLYLLGSSQFPKIAYWDKIPELAGAYQSAAQPKVAYVVACPRLDSNAKEQLETKWQGTFQRRASLDLSSCPSCAICEVDRYDRSL